MFKNFKLSATHIIIIILFVVHLLPIWIFKYFPTQDGLSHVYNAYVLKDYHKHENYKLREVFKLNLALFPNWTSHALMALLMYVFPPIVCEKILLSLCIALLPLSLFYFLNAVNKGKVLFGLLGFIYAYNYLLHMGFYNFALSIPLFFFTLGYWWKHKDEMSSANIVILYILLLGTYFCHFQSYFQLLLSLSFLTLFSSIYSAFARTWGYRKTLQNDGETLSSRLKMFIVNLKPLLLFFGSMLPAYFIMLSYYLSKTRGYGRDYKDFKELKEYFFDMKSLVAFRDDHILIGRIVLYLLAVAFLLTLWYRIREVYKFRRSPISNTPQSIAPKERLWTKIINGREQFLLMAGILTVIYFKAPWYIKSGGAWINDRIHIYIFLILLPFFSISFHKYIRYAIGGIIIALSLWHLSYNVHTYYYLNKDIAEMTSSAGMLEEHTVFTGRPGEWGGPSDYLGDLKYVAPFLHVPSYLCLKNGVAYLPDYEAEHNYFPINFKDDYSGPADYVLVWKTEYDEIKELEDDYVMIHAGKYNKLYRIKKAEPDEDLWGGRKVIKFDMQPHDGQTAPEHIAIFEDTVYINGRYGWATESSREEFRNEAEIPEPYRDGVWSEEDGVFRVALPNGIYKVTCYFGSNESEAHKINITANGKKVINNLKVPAGNETVNKSYIVTVTDKRLTQVIYTARGYNKRWMWSGCSIERNQ